MTRFEELKCEVLPTIPHRPGVYKYFDQSGNLLYVGKAKNLRKRVASYFTKKQESGKTRIMVRKIDKIEFTVVETEQDALLLENVLIKEMQPKYNVLLKDDKTYPYICIKKERFPRIFLTRNIIKDGSEYLGPYTSIHRVRAILELLRGIFQIRTCNLNLSEKHIAAGKYKVCLEYHLGNCLGPCENLQTEASYNDTISQIRNILKGNFVSVVRYLKGIMQTYADNFEFEKAQEVKVKLDMLQDYQSKSTVVNPKLNYIDVFHIDEDEKAAYISYLQIANGSIIRTKVIELAKKLEELPEDLLLFGVMELRQRYNSTFKEMILPFKIDFPDKSVTQTIPRIGDKKKLLDLAKKNAFYFRKQRQIRLANRKKGSERQFEVLQRLQKDLQLPTLPKHIECFDNSNFQGAYPVASMVLFRNGKPANKEYRHFNIKTVEGPNDFASMEEVVYRRYKRLLDESRELPQLIIIDGGKGQLSSAFKSLVKLNIQKEVRIIGIAKRLEEIFTPGDPTPLYIDLRSPSLKLIQHLRNEAHRFAITFHRNKRSKGTFRSELESIEGIGTKTTQKLLSHFKSIDIIREAKEKELTAVVSKKQAKAIVKYFKSDEL